MEQTIIVFMVTLIAIQGVGFGILIHLQQNKNRLHNQQIEHVINRALSQFGNVTNNVSDYFSTKVLEIYRDILCHPNDWEVDHYNLQNKKLKISIWAANAINDREFNSFNGWNSEEALKFNNELTLYDKILLDKLIKALRNRNESILLKFFI